MSRKNVYDDIDMLLKDLKSDIEDVLMDEVLDEVKDIELRNVYRYVFSTYHPKIYDRRANLGIDDPNNIVGHVHNMQLEVDNITKFNNDYGTFNRGIGLADLINDGENLSGYFYDYPGEFEKPRPFIDNTIEEIEQTKSVEDVLAKGLRKRKYDVK